MTKPWRELLPIHQAALFLPRITSDELEKLADDIRKHGLRHGVTIIEHPPPRRPALLDGISRLDALARLGRDLFDEGERLRDEFIGERVAPDADAVAYVISANIRRRHLDQKEKRTLICRFLQLDPWRSDRQTAKLAGVDHHTVGAVRAEAEGRGEIPHAGTRVDSSGREQPAAKIITTRASRRNPPAVKIVPTSVSKRELPVMTINPTALDAATPTPSPTLKVLLDAWDAAGQADRAMFMLLKGLTTAH